MILCLMSTHNIGFHGEIRKISAFFGRKKHPICCYELQLNARLNLNCRQIELEERMKICYKQVRQKLK